MVAKNKILGNLSYLEKGYQFWRIFARKTDPVVKDSAPWLDMNHTSDIEIMSCSLYSTLEFKFAFEPSKHSIKF